MVVISSIGVELLAGQKKGTSVVNKISKDRT